MVEGGATGAVHQLSKARQEVGVTVTASSDAVTPKPEWVQEEGQVVNNSQVIYYKADQETVIKQISCQEYLRGSVTLY